MEDQADALAVTSMVTRLTSAGSARPSALSEREAHASVRVLLRVPRLRARHSRGGNGDSRDLTAWRPRELGPQSRMGGGGGLEALQESREFLAQVRQQARLERVVFLFPQGFLQNECQACDGGYVRLAAQIPHPQSVTSV